MKLIKKNSFKVATRILVTGVITTSLYSQNLFANQSSVPSNVAKSSHLESHPFINGVSDFSDSSINLTLRSLLLNRGLDVSNVKTITEMDLTDQEKEIITYLGQKMDEGKLENEVDRIFSVLKERSERLKNMDEKAQASAKAQLIYTIKANVKISRNNPDSWWVVSDNISAKLSEAEKENSNQSVDETSKGSSSLDLDFLKFITKWNNSNEISRAEIVEPLVNGEQSFKKRDEVVAMAQSSIDILSWSIYDDNTGNYLYDQLSQIVNTKPNIKIRILVDGQTAQLDGHKEIVKKLKTLSSQIEVVEFFDNTTNSFADYFKSDSHVNNYKGMHRKMLIVDGYHVIAGGMNYGDVYSHRGNPGTQMWRDTDVYFKGGLAAENAQRLFQKVWNEQVESNNLDVKPIANNQIIKASPTTENMPIVAVLNSYPGEEPKRVASDVLMTHMYAIRKAKTSIDIENAYLINIPVIQNEIKMAIERNPNLVVRILTNSNTSVDEPIVSTPILRSVKELAQLDPSGKRVQIYLKKGDTLHSKFLTVDGQFTMVMSYNLHPRSERVEGEMAIAILDKGVSQKFKSIFENDIKPENADYKTFESIMIPNDFFALGYITRLFFDVH